MENIFIMNNTFSSVFFSTFCIFTNTVGTLLLSDTRAKSLILKSSIKFVVYAIL